MRSLFVLTPVYDDWAAFALLLRDLDSTLQEDAHVLCIDDGSASPMPAALAAQPWKRILSVECYRLRQNSGHQKAIAAGLAQLQLRHEELGAVVIMDADGQDRPEFIAKLRALQRESGAEVVVAARGSRREGARFQLSYLLFRKWFRLAVGRELDFGNFMLLSPAAVRRLAGIPQARRHLAATVLFSGLPLASLCLDRAGRSSGRSRMSPLALAAHAHAAISVGRELSRS